MKKIITISFIIFILASCFCIKETKSVYIKEKNMTPCDSLSNFLVENWHHNDSLNTYTYNKMIFEEMQVYEGYKGKYWNCMKNLTQKSLIALFGLPNQSRKDELWYYFNQKCYDGMKDGCMFISFHFGRDSLFEQSVITSVKKMQ